jgi:hypothetical protein
VKHAVATVAATLAVLLGSGCSAPAQPVLNVTAGSSPPSGGLSDTGASVPVGIILELDVQPMNYDGTVSVSVRADDPGVASVVPMTTQNDFVLIGVAAGTTTLHFFANGAAATHLTVSGDGESALTVQVPVQTPPS